MNPLLHLSTLRACHAHLAAHGWRGARRDSAAHTFMLGALSGAIAQAHAQWADADDCAVLVDLIRQRGYRELNAQIHALTLTARGTPGRHGDDI